MKAKSVKVNTTSFEINKLITSTQLFSKIKLSVSARLVLRCIVDYWNFKIGFAYPTQATIAKATGLTEVAVGSAVKELDNKGLIEKEKKQKRIYYYFTLKLLGYLGLTPKIIYVNTQKNLCNIPQSFYDKNILKDFKNTSFQNQSSLNEEQTKDEPQTEQITGKRFAEIAIERFKNNPTFSAIVTGLKEKYGL